MYRERIKVTLSHAEQRVFAKLTTPRKIQDYLDTLPANFEMSGETYMSPRRVLRHKVAHCFEGALFAAAVLGYHGRPTYLMDLQTVPDDEDHVVTLFKENDRWGAISKTNHVILRYRDAVYRDPRELAMSFFHEYFLSSGKKSLRAYSKPFDLARYKPERWVTAEEELEWLVDALDTSKHFPVAPKKNLRALRKVGKVEIKSLDIVEWKPPKGYKG